MARIIERLERSLADRPGAALYRIDERHERRSSWPLASRQRQLDTGSAVRRRVEPELTAEGMRELACDREAETGPTRLVTGEEGPEDALAFLERHPSSRAGYRDLDGAVPRIVADGEGPAVRPAGGR